MKGAELFEEVMNATLKHLLTMEHNMLALLPKIKKGNKDAQATYEWYLQCSKQLGIKELATLGKMYAPSEEVNEGFDGFDES